jgi:3-phenylpropionate/cinnamic acid dioxygenase small subunit
VTADLDAIAHKLEITEVLYLYATALDTRDWELLRLVFAEDAVYSIGQHGEFTGVRAISEKISSLIGGYESTQHLITNPVIELDGKSARSRCYVHAQHYLTAQRTGANTYEIGGTYRDEFVRTGDGWRITRRVLEVGWRDGNAGLSAAARGR